MIFWTSLIITPFLFFTVTEFLVHILYKSFVSDVLRHILGTSEILIGTYFMISIALTSFLPVYLWKLFLKNKFDKQPENSLRK